MLVLSNPPSPGAPLVPEVTVAIVGESAFLLDVREDEEWRAGHAPDAHHLPMRQLHGRLAEIPRDQEVVVVCRVGARSAQAVAFLQTHGWTRAVNLSGGMHAWQAGGRPMVSEDGHSARVL